MRHNRWATVGLLALGAALIILGVTQGQPLAVFAQAATICLECIGIG